MTIQPISNQRISPLNFTSTLEKIPHQLFEGICSNLNPEEMKNFLSTCKIIEKTNSDLKKNSKRYSKLMMQVLYNSFGIKSIEQLSDQMISFCNNTKLFKIQRERSGERYSTEEINLYQREQFLKLKNLLDSLVICGKFSEVSKENLEKAFTWCYMYNHADMLELFIKSGRYHDIGIDCLNRIFVIDTAKGDGSTVDVFINSDRFKEISIENIGKVLNSAVENGYTRILKAILESERAHEITVKDFTTAFAYATGNRNSFKKKASSLEILEILMSSSQFNKVSREDLGKAFVEASLNGRSSAVHKIVLSSRFDEITKEQLNKAFFNALWNSEPESIRAIIESSRSCEIDSKLREASRIPTEQIKVYLEFSQIRY